MGRAAEIERKLTEGLNPTRLAVVDESCHHEGHGGWRPEGETHFRVEIVAESFAGKSRVDRQRQVYALIGEELKTGLHALALTTLAPGEDGA